jgi:hypothetical protein
MLRLCGLSNSSDDAKSLSTLRTLKTNIEDVLHVSRDLPADAKPVSNSSGFVSLPSLASFFAVHAKPADAAVKTSAPALASPPQPLSARTGPPGSP